MHRGRVYAGVAQIFPGFEDLTLVCPFNMGKTNSTGALISFARSFGRFIDLNLFC